MIAAFVQRALAGEPLSIAGTGSQSRRFVYVEDLAEGAVCGLQEAAANRVFNLAGRESVSIRDVAETVQQTVGEAEIVYTPPRAGDFDGKEISTERAERELGWIAATPFAAGVARYVDMVPGTQSTAPAGPDPHRGHRRGTRPAGTGARRRPRDGGPGDRGRRSRTASRRWVASSSS